MQIRRKSLNVVITRRAFRGPGVRRGKNTKWNYLSFKTKFVEEASEDSIMYPVRAACYGNSPSCGGLGRALY